MRAANRSSLTRSTSWRHGGARRDHEGARPARRAMVREAGAKPAFLGYRGYPATLCISVNEEVVHGIPRRRR